MPLGSRQRQLVRRNLRLREGSFEAHNPVVRRIVQALVEELGLDHRQPGGVMRTAIPGIGDFRNLDAVAFRMRAADQIRKAAGFYGRFEQPERPSQQSKLRQTLS
jgi:hypothetical protein